MPPPAVSPHRSRRWCGVELRTVVVEERCWPPVLLTDVDLANPVRRGWADNLVTLDVPALDAPQQQTNAVALPALVEQLAEHLHTGDGGLGGRWANADDLNFLVLFDSCQPSRTTVPGGRNGEDVRPASGTACRSADRPESTRRPRSRPRTEATHFASPSSAFERRGPAQPFACRIPKKPAARGPPSRRVFE